MKSRDISGVSSSFFGRLRDNVGAVRKRNQLKRLEPYADIIDEVFESYNTDDNSRTMMYKLLRSPVEGTVTRRKHTENCREIAGEIADSFDWLSSDITRVMARHHDIGHTFLGHSGEWWLSSIKDKYGMPNFVHNAIGARNLSIRYKASDEIVAKIKAKYPTISKTKLKAIKNDLWLIYDAINGHNGEKSEYSYAPDFSKTKGRYDKELMACYTTKGFDRTLIPATAEGSLMRLTDKISYIPFDMVDIFRNKCNMEKGTVNGEEYDFYEAYRKAFKDLGMSDDSLDRLLACKTEEDYDNFAKEVQAILIADVKKATRINNIRMSKEMSDVMHSIRDINNKLMVNYTVMKEDHEQYVPAMEKYMKAASKFIKRNGLINPTDVRKSRVVEFYNNPKGTEELLDSYRQSDQLSYELAQYIAGISPEDFEFTVTSCEKAFEETIKGEIEVARAVATGTVDAVEIQAQGNKKKRIQNYIDEFNAIISATYDDARLRKTMNPLSKNPLDRLRREMWLDKASQKIKEKSMAQLKEGGPGITPLYEMVGMEIGAQYLASLNDYEWRRTFERFTGADKSTMESLGRPYQSFDFRAEHQKHKTWDNIQKLQEQSTATRLTDDEKNSAIGIFRKIFKSRER